MRIKKGHLSAFFLNGLVLITMILLSSCGAKVVHDDYVGSTPGDEAIKSMLAIPAGSVDFIRWSLTLENEHSFQLDIHYVESQPGTLGFKDGSQTTTIQGTYLVTADLHVGFREIYTLKSDSLPEDISLAKLNENILHILTPQRQLMVGNGGWSYTLNRNTPVNTDDILIASLPSEDKSLQLVFEGRTPCQEFAAEHPEMQASSSCFKLKWKLTLNRDSVTYLPTTCLVRNIVDNQPRDVAGKWDIIKGTAAHPQSVIYRIMPDNLSDPLLLLAGDENVLFFLDKNYAPLTGNVDFSFTLNKRE